MWPGDLSPFRTGFLKVALFVSGAWLDIPMTELSDDGVQIKRGRGDEGGKTDPGRLTFSVKDPTGKYAPRHPGSPLYGLIGRGTKVRVQVELVAGTVLDRFYGEVTTWEPRWTRKGGPSARVDVEAAGLLRRLGQGASPVKSPLYRFETTVTGATVRGYWPLEGGQLLGALLPQRGTSRPMTVEGRPKYSTFTDLLSSGPLPTLGTSRITARPDTYSDATGVYSTVRLAVRVPNGIATGLAVARLNGADGPGVDLTYSTASGGSLLLAGTSFITGIDDTPTWVWVNVRTSGGNLEWIATAQPFGSTIPTGTSGSVLGSSFGGVSSVVLNPNRSALGDTAAGHVMIVAGAPLYSTPEVTAFNAYIGEQAHARVTRLCTENGLTSSILGLASSEPMGHQLQADLLTLLRECEDTDGGFLYEPLSTTNLEYRTLASLFSQTPVTVPYVANMLLPFEPVEDDSNTRNKVTVTRAGGGAYTVTETTGPLGTTAVGIYDEQVTLSLGSDADAVQQAAWRVHLGTTDEARWPQIGVDLAEAAARPDGRAPRMSGATRTALLGLRLGDRLDVPGLPAWLPPFTVSQLVQGYTETITPKSYRLVFTCAPAGPYRVAFWTAGGRDRWSGDGSTVAAITTTTQNTFNVTPPGIVRWTTTDVPFDVLVNGEQMTVTAVGAFAGGVQLFTVTRGVNGVRKTHAALSPLTLADPCYYGL